ncbi:MAG: exopolyphosphatase-related protein [Halorubrum sp. J07HR59]|nr:MAG: exopolyphosphatase-related protein [Halorubrum sp. J07HR59]
MSAGAEQRSQTSYVILGCGSVGHAVAEELDSEGKDVLILDRDETRVESLRDQDLTARRQDIGDPAVTDAVAGRDIVLILSSDTDANKDALMAIRESGSDQYIVVRAADPVSEDELREHGADVVINPSTVISNSALRSLETGELEYLARQLAEILETDTSDMAIITHESPDPDSIASAVALRAVADTFGVDASIIYKGEVGHQENRAFVNLLGIELLAWEDAKQISEYDTVALVDYTKTGDEQLSDPVDVYIDHREPPEEITAEFLDIRADVSSTSTILTKYLQEFDISPSEEVATALLYGIRAETMDFKRDTTPADLTAAAYLHPFANHDTLEQVESPSMSPETLDVLAKAIQNREIQGSHLFTTAGFVSGQEPLVQAAQHLLNLEGITTTAVLGIADEEIYVAARCKDIRIDIGNVLKDAFEEMGEATGHSTQGSVEVPLGIFTGIETTDDNRDTLLSLTKQAVRRKLFASLGVEGTNGNTTPD